MIAGFLAVTIPLVLMPGASTAVVLRNSIAGGTRAGVETTVGIHSASACYGLLTAFGFSLALRRWPSAWVALQAGGALYLGWLAAQSIWRATTAPAAALDASQGGARPLGFVRNAYQGFVTNGLNPSVAMFYVAILPQFIPAGASIARYALLLTGIHVSLAASWHVAWAAAGGTLARVLARGRGRQVLELIAGVTLGVMSVMVALRT